MGDAASSPQRFAARIGALCATVVLMCGCGGGKSPGGDAELGRSRLVPHAAVDAYGAQFEAWVEGRYATAAGDPLDWREIVDRATAGSSLTDSQRTAFRRGAKAAYETRGLGAELRQLVARGGIVRYLRARDADDETHAVFRLTEPDGGGLNYFALVVQATEAGDGCVAVDMYNYLSAERLSERVRQIVLRSTGAGGQGLTQQAGTSHREVSDYRRVVGLLEASEQGDDRKVIELFEALPKSLQSNKSLLLMFLRASGSRNEREYLTALEVYRGRHSRDPSLDLLMFDAYVVNRQFDAARDCLDRLDKAVGGDAYLDVLQAAVCVAERDLVAAQRTIDRALQTDANTEHAHWVALTISLQAREFAETSRLLDRIRAEFGIVLPDLTKVSEYAEFVASPEYRAWMRRRVKSLTKPS